MAQRFDVAGRLVTVNYAGGGNINDTYLAIFRTVFSEERFILQRINKKVFADPTKVMSNIHLVTQHCHQKLEEEQDFSDRIWQIPRVIPTKDGKDYTIDADGDYWRAITVIASATAFDKIQSPEHALEIGSVLGQFHRIISDLDMSNMSDTLPGFHITPGYLKTLDDALATEEGKRRIDASSRAKNILHFIEAHRDWCGILERAKEKGELKLRPIHGDPKVSNIMIDNATGKGTSIIDLDTVKPGLIHYDIGDCLRSCCNPAGEEAEDLTSVYFDTMICQAVLRGYRAHAQNFLTDADKAYICDAVKLITFELCLRFFADYVAGDVYFKTTHEGHNLHRANVQMTLFNSIEAREQQIQQIIEKM